VFKIERDRLDFEDKSSMIRDFVMIGTHSNRECPLRTKIKNLEEAGFALVIVADKSLWRI